MTPEEFRAIYPQVIGWIQQTLAAHSQRAQTVASKRFRRLPHYFTEELLESSKVVIVERVPVPPLSAIGLSQFAAFERGEYGGITYLNTFFIRQQRADDEQLHFHELIHVVQWRLLGPERFVTAYADGLEKFGYRDSPLETMAYDAEAAFAQSTQPFNAENFVAEQLKRILVA